MHNLISISMEDRKRASALRLKRRAARTAVPSPRQASPALPSSTLHRPLLFPLPPSFKPALDEDPSTAANVPTERRLPASPPPASTLDRSLSFPLSLCSIYPAPSEDPSTTAASPVVCSPCECHRAFIFVVVCVYVGTTVRLLVGFDTWQ